MNYVVLLVVSVLLAVSGGAAAAPQAWPLRHIAKQREYTPLSDNEHAKPWWYDFPGRRLRTDIHLVRGTPQTDSARNFTSFWLNSTLYMYDLFEQSCTKLEMGFDMMRPDWFLTDSTPMPNVFLTQRNVENPNGTSAFRNCSWTRKDGFDYFADEDGAAFRLTAGSPDGYVINDFVSMTEVSGFDEAIFELPDIPCATSTDGTTPVGIQWPWFALEG